MRSLLLSQAGVYGLRLWPTVFRLTALSHLLANERAWRDQWKVRDAPFSGSAGG